MRGLGDNGRGDDGAALVCRAAALGWEPSVPVRVVVGGAPVPSSAAEQLAELTLEHGTSTFLLPAHAPDQLLMFGEEVAPAVRATVAAERERSSEAGTP